MGDGGVGIVKFIIFNFGKIRVVMIEFFSFNFFFDCLVYIIVSMIGFCMFGLINLWDVGFVCCSCYWW